MNHSANELELMHAILQLLVLRFLDLSNVLGEISQRISMLELKVNEMQIVIEADGQSKMDKIFARRNLKFEIDRNELQDQNDNLHPVNAMFDVDQSDNARADDSGYDTAHD